MKRYSILGLAAISISFLFFACERMEPTIAPQEGNETPDGAVRTELVSATLEGDGQSTKVDVASSTGVTSWSEGDEIAYCVTPISGANTPYYITKPINDEVGSILMTIPDGYQRANYAVYPASAAGDVLVGNPTVVYPTSYDLDGKGTNYAPCPMIASNTSGALHFYHVGALVRLQVEDIPEGTTSIDVYFLGASHLTGTFSVPNAGTASAACSVISGTGNKVTFTNGSTGFSGSVCLNVPVPSGKHPGMRKIQVRCTGSSSTVRMVETVSWRKFPRRWGRTASLDGDDVTTSGMFTVNADGKMVEIAPGNLQATIGGPGAVANTYVASSWNFAENQWSYLGSTNSFNTGQKMDLFSWVGEDVADAYDSYGLCSLSATNATYHGSKTTGTLKTDWGAIPGVVSTLGAGWFTLSQAEWVYLFNSRSCARRFARAIIRTDAASDANIKGLILFPDDFPAEESFEGVTFRDMNGKGAYGNNESAWTTSVCTVCTVAGWEALEATGCVFLPVAGYRSASSVNSFGVSGNYWTSSAYNSSNAFYGVFYWSEVNPQGTYGRFNGFSVRLVREI